MSGLNKTYNFVTELRIRFAVNLANEIAEKNHAATAYECAERAVNTIFGRWLFDHSGTVRAHYWPTYLRLVCDVEQRMGLHRRRKQHDTPNTPAAASLPAMASNVEARSNLLAAAA